MDSTKPKKKFYYNPGIAVGLRKVHSNLVTVQVGVACSGLGTCVLRRTQHFGFGNRLRLPHEHESDLASHNKILAMNGQANPAGLGDGNPHLRRVMEIRLRRLRR